MEYVYREPTEHAWVNVFAVRCLRDTADHDYIAARLAIRSGLGAQFLWSASQAIEKYLKCMLFFYRIDTKDLGHKLKSALELVNNRAGLNIKLDAREQKFFNHLVEWDSDRYLLRSFWVRFSELADLDALVWKLRLYCQALNKRHYADDPCDIVLRQRIVEVEEILRGKIIEAGYLPAGGIEKILADQRHAAHDALVWHNSYYSLTPGEPLHDLEGFVAVNAPLFHRPDLIETVHQWMKMNPVLKEVRLAAAKKGAASKKKPK